MHRWQSHCEGGSGGRSSHRKKLPLVVYVLALGTFLMATTEFVVAGLLPDIATDLNISVGQAGLSITVFAIGMIVGAPLMSMLTLRLPSRATLSLALAIFALGHVVVALASSFPVILVARFVTALATGAFWAVANIVASRAAGSSANSRALGVVGAGGMLASVVGVPAGAVAGQVMGWRGPFWMLAALSIVAAGLIMHTVDHNWPEPGSVSIRSELAGMRSLRLWLALAACVTVAGGVLSTYSYISPLLTDRTELPTGVVPLVLVGFGIGALGGSLLGEGVGRRPPAPCDDNRCRCREHCHPSCRVCAGGVGSAHVGSVDSTGPVRARCKSSPNRSFGSLRWHG